MDSSETHNKSIKRQYLLRNMLSKSCEKLIALFFQNVKGVKVLSVRLGSVELEIEPSLIAEAEIDKHFEELGFPVVKDPDLLVVEKTKTAAIELIHYAYNTNSLIRNSEYISDRIQIPYEKISKIFSRVTGTTLEKYIILLKIEKAKELISNNEFTLSEISYMLGYSSVHYLSNQFKKVTGITVSGFKENPQPYRRTLEELVG